MSVDAVHAHRIVRHRKDKVHSSGLHAYVYIAEIRLAGQAGCDEMLDAMERYLRDYPIGSGTKQAEESPGIARFLRKHIIPERNIHA